MFKRTLCVLAILNGFGCGGSPKQASVASDATGAHAANVPTALAPLSLPEVTEKSPPESTIAVTFSVERKYIDTNVEKYAPKRLHEERGRDIGSGVKLDLVVTRGIPSYSVTATEVLLQLPVGISIDVRRRIGPIDLNLGHCNPNVLASAKVFTTLGPNLTVQAPEISLKLTEPCHLSGFDVTGIVETEIDKQKPHIERQIREQMSVVVPLLKAQVLSFEQNLAANELGCARFLTERILQAPLSEQGDVLSTSIALQGQMTQDCGTITQKPLDVVQTKAPLRFDVNEPSRITWQALLRDLDPLFQQTGVGNAPLQMRSAKTPAGERVALGISGKASGWVFLEPRVESSRLLFVVREAENAALRKRVTEVLAQFALPIDLAQVKNHALALAERARRLSFVERSNVVGAATRLETVLVPMIEPAGLLLLSRSHAD